MDIEKRNDQRREKRRHRLSIRGSSSVSGQATNSELKVSSFTDSSWILRLTRPSRKRTRKGAPSDTNAENCFGRPTTQEEEFKLAEEPETDDPDIEDFRESRRQSPDRLPSPYALPGAFRVSSYVDNRHIEEIALEDVSIDSYSTSKTPHASLVVHGSLQNLNDENLPIAFPQTNVLLVTKRHLFICVALSCIAFGGLFTGFLFALWDPQERSNTTNDGFFHDEALQDTSLVSLEPTPPPTKVMQTSSTSLLFTVHPTIPPVVFPESPTKFPTNFPSPSPVLATAMPTLETKPPSPSPILDTEFSLTSQPVAMTATTRMSLNEVP